MGRVWARFGAAALLLHACLAQQHEFLHLYASGEGDDSKPPPQPFETTNMPSQLATIHPDHPLYADDTEEAASDALMTYWPKKIKFSNSGGRSSKREKIRPPHPPNIPPFFSSEEMTQAFFLDNPQFAASNNNPRRPQGQFFFTGGGGKKGNKGGSSSSRPPPFETTPDPSPAASTSTFQPDTTTYFINSSLVDLTGDSSSDKPSTPSVSRDVATTPAKEGLLVDYLVPPLETAHSEYLSYNKAANRRPGPPPFSILRLQNGGKPPTGRGKGGKGRFRGPTGPNLIFAESQKNNVYKLPPRYASGPHGGPLGPGPYIKPLPPTQSGFLRYLLSQDAAASTTAYPLFNNFFLGGETNDLQRPPPSLKVNKKKQLPFPPPFYNPDFYNSNRFRPSTSTVMVPEKQGWVPIMDPNLPSTWLPHTSTTPLPGRFPPPHFQFGSTVSPPPSSPRPIFLTPQPTRPTPTFHHHHQGNFGPTTQQSIADAPTAKNQINATPTTVTPTPHKAQTNYNVEIVPSIETPLGVVSSQSNNPISEFNAEYFLQQALAQVRHQTLKAEQKQKESSNNHKNNSAAPQQQPTRRSFVSELPNTDEGEVIYQNPEYNVYEDPGLTIHYPAETNFRFKQRSRGLLDVSEDASQFLDAGGRQASAMNPPSYYDFHLNNIPTTLPPQPTEAADFHYMLSAVKPKINHEKSRTEKKGRPAAPLPRNRRPTGEPFLVYPEPTTPSPDQLFATSFVTPRTLRGMRLGPSSQVERVSDTETSESSNVEIVPSQETNLEVLKATGGLFKEEIVHYHAPVRPDAQFI